MGTIMAVTGLFAVVIAINGYTLVFPLQPYREPLHELTSHEAGMHSPTAP